MIFLCSVEVLKSRNQCAKCPGIQTSWKQVFGLCPWSLESLGSVCLGEDIDCYVEMVRFRLTSAPPGLLLLHRDSHVSAAAGQRQAAKEAGGQAEEKMIGTKAGESDIG